jgi:nucleotide-binding universal stress UspA family protein
MALHDRILVATDLGAGSDRALDRALDLARRLRGELVIVHVLATPPPGSHFHLLADTAREQLRYDVGDYDAKIRIEEGDPAHTIARVAHEEASTLIVVGVARSERFGRVTLGRTVERLVRGVDAPLLIVAERPRGDYRKIAVAADFSSVSLQSLEVTAHLFPEQPITVFHAYEPLASYGASDQVAHAAHFRDAAEDAFARWLTTADLAPATRSRLIPRIQHGEPAAVLRHATEEGAFDLVVVGTRGRGRLFEFFVGSIAKRILVELPCDALIVRESPVAARASA